MRYTLMDIIENNKRINYLENAEDFWKITYEAVNSDNDIYYLEKLCLHQPALFKSLVYFSSDIIDLSLLCKEQLEEYTTKVTSNLNSQSLINVLGLLSNFFNTPNESSQQRILHKMFSNAELSLNAFAHSIFISTIKQKIDYLPEDFNEKLRISMYKLHNYNPNVFTYNQYLQLFKFFFANPYMEDMNVLKPNVFVIKSNEEYYIIGDCVFKDTKLVFYNNFHNMNYNIPSVTKVTLNENNQLVSFINSNNQKCVLEQKELISLDIAEIICNDYEIYNTSSPTSKDDRSFIIKEKMEKSAFTINNIESMESFNFQVGLERINIINIKGEVDKKIGTYSVRIPENYVIDDKKESVEIYIFNNSYYLKLQ